ncbi:MAG: hypothetical protein AAF182_03505, partial [Pseudomonadota bacterium]
MGLKTAKKYITAFASLAFFCTMSANFTPSNSTQIQLTQSAYAQYFVRKKTDEEKAAEEANKEPASETNKKAPLTVIPKKSGSAAKIERRQVNPLYVRKTPPKKKQELNEEDLRENPTAIFFTPEAIAATEAAKNVKLEFSAQDIQNEFATDLGECSEEDLLIQEKFQKALVAAQQESARFAQEIVQDQDMREMAEADFEEISKEVQETGELPDKLKKVAEKRPERVTAVWDEFQDEVDPQEYLESFLKCANMAELLKNSELGDL